MLGGKKAKPATAKAAARGAAKQDAFREAMQAHAEQAAADTATGRGLVDLLCDDPSLSPHSVSRIRALAERVLTPGDLAGLLAYRVEKLRQGVEAGEISAERQIGGLDKLGVYATAVVQLQAAQTSSAGGTVQITWGGFTPPAPPEGRNSRPRDAKVGDIVDAE